MKRITITADPRPDLHRRDVVNVDGLGRGTVLSVKPGEEVWWIEVRLDDGRGFSVPVSHVWVDAAEAA